MCGITAISRASQSSLPDGRRALIAALVAIESRGPDSTGVAWTRGKAAKVWYHKLVGRSSRVANRLDLDVKARIHTAIGHTRWASQGAVNITNAHPVVASNIVLVHNGHVSNDDDLVALAGRKRVGEVDSWALASLLASQAKLGASHPIELLELVEGRAAIAWLDSDDPQALHLARLTGSPMTVAFTRRGDLVMSSTRQTMRQTCKLAGVGVEDVIDVPEGTYLRVVRGKPIEWVTFSPHREPPPRRYTVTTQPQLPLRSPVSGITDLVANRPEDWWDAAEKLLGDTPRPEFEWNEADPWRRKQ